MAIVQTKNYEKCKKKYAIILVTDYSKTYTYRRFLKYKFSINKKTYEDELREVYGAQGTQPRSLEDIQPNYFINHYFIMEYCPSSNRHKLHLTKRLYQYYGKEYFGIELDSIFIHSLIDPNCLK